MKLAFCITLISCPQLSQFQCVSAERSERTSHGMDDGIFDGTSVATTDVTAETPLALILPREAVSSGF